jgi:hypothetical protein
MMTTKERMLEAIANSGGNKSLIARRLGLASGRAVHTILQRAGWESLMQAYWDEVDSVADDAEECIRDAITQRLDMDTASRNARWFLERRKSDLYGQKSTTVIEGGESPIQIHQKSAVLNVDVMNLPLETRKTILAAIEQQEEQRRQADVVLEQAAVSALVRRKK